MDDEDKVEAILGLGTAHRFLIACKDAEPAINDRNMAVGYRWARWAVAAMAETLTENVQNKGYWRRQAEGMLFVAQETYREAQSGNTRSDRAAEESAG